MRFPAGVRALLARAAACPEILLALDFDGTLAPLRGRPDRVSLDPERRALLARLNRGRFRLAVISGRSLGDLRAIIGLAGVVYGGVFGLQMMAPGWRHESPRARTARRNVPALAARLRRALADVPGALVEDKGVGLCVHYRGVPPRKRPAFDRRLARALAKGSRGLRWRRGPRSWEATPPGAGDKGAALRRIWNRAGRPPMIIAVGDDRFDEPMLRFANARGAGLRVGLGRSRAALRLAGVTQVWAFLRALEAGAVPVTPLRAKAGSLPAALRRTTA